MPTLSNTYRIYCYDGQTMTLSGHALKATRDAEAIAEAEASDFGTSCEIWQGRRLVAALPPAGARPEKAP